MTKSIRSLLFVLVLMSFIVVACGPAATRGPTEAPATEAPTEAPVATEVPTGAPTVDPMSM